MDKHDHKHNKRSHDHTRKHGREHDREDPASHLNENERHYPGQPIEQKQSGEKAERPEARAKEKDNRKERHKH